MQFILLTALNIFGNLLKSKHSLIICLFILQLQYINTAAPIAQIHHCSRVWLLTYSSVTIAACRKYVAFDVMGEKAGLWSLLQKERHASSDKKKPAPLLKVWCSVHRSQLAWQSVSNTVVEGEILFSKPDKHLIILPLICCTDQRSKEIGQGT